MDEGFARMTEGFARCDARMDQGFARSDARMDHGFGRCDARMDEGFARLDARIDSMARAVIYGSLTLSGAMITGFVAILTQI
jgi:hypothetical protein